MSENQKPAASPSEEVDLGQFFGLIRNGLRSVFKSLLNVFVYIRNHFVWLAGLVVVGLAAGYGIQKATPVELGIEAIVSPNLESKNYLLRVVEEIQSNIASGDTTFLRRQGIGKSDIEGFSIEIEPAVETDATRSNQEIKYLQMLQNFGPAMNVADIVRAELLDKTSLDYRITFRFRDPVSGPVIADKLMGYINSNSYYTHLVDTYRENARERIAYNDSLLRQTDVLIQDYRKRMMNANPVETNRLVLDGEQDVDITALLELKKELVQDTESRRMSLARVQSGVTVLHFGTPHPLQKSFLDQWIYLTPVLLVTGFLLFSLFRYLNRKAREYKVE